MPLLVLLFLLTVYGLFVLYSASGKDMGAVVRQGRYFVVAYVIMFLGAQISLQRYMRWSPWPCTWVGVATLVAVMFFWAWAPRAPSAGCRSAGFRFQPSEIMKLGGAHGRGLVPGGPHPAADASST